MLWDIKLFWYKEEVELLIKFWGSPQKEQKDAIYNFETHFTILRELFLKNLLQISFV